MKISFPLSSSSLDYFYLTVECTARRSENPSDFYLPDISTICPAPFISVVQIFSSVTLSSKLTLLPVQFLLLHVCPEWVLFSLKLLLTQSWSCYTPSFSCLGVRVWAKALHGTTSPPSQALLLFFRPLPSAPGPRNSPPSRATHTPLPFKPSSNVFQRNHSRHSLGTCAMVTWSHRVVSGVYVCVCLLC